MARTKQTARKSTGGKAPRRMLSMTRFTRNAIPNNPARSFGNLKRTNQKSTPVDLMEVVECEEKRDFDETLYLVLQAEINHKNNLIRIKQNKKLQKSHKIHKQIQKVIKTEGPSSLLPAFSSAAEIQNEIKDLQNLYTSSYISTNEYTDRIMFLESQRALSKDQTELPCTDYSSGVGFAEGYLDSLNQQSTSNPNVRIFISSTFKDMTEERNLIIKHVFPKLKKLCDSRGVFLSQVDLRWGITTEQSQSGETINICLKEVDRCRPYFVCMLGGRYGWHQPDPINFSADRQSARNDPLLTKTFLKSCNEYEWIKGYSDRSITELEVRHAVLNNQNSITAKKALFYFNESQESDNVKLDALKKEVLKSKLNVKQYLRAEDMAQFLYQDLVSLIDEDFPETKKPRPLDIQRAAHDAFMEARSRIYVPRKDYFSRITHNITSPSSKPLMIIGERGSGKSSLVSNWVKLARRQFSNKVIISHFVGCNSESCNLGQMLRRLIGEMKDKFGIAHEVPTETKQLIEEFPQWILEVSQRGGMILVIDALNQLEDSKLSDWLPRTFPAQIRVVVSTLPQRELGFPSNNWETLTIDPLTPIERRSVVETYLKAYGKTLTDNQIQPIINADQCQNVLFLRIILEELRLMGTFENLGSAISTYLNTTNHIELFKLVFDRLENDYGTLRPKVVQEILSLIWVSRRGISEMELLGILNIPHAVWSPINLAMEEMIITRSGFITFFHDYMRQTVEKFFITDNGHHWRQMIVNYLQNNEDIDKTRYVEEIPFQLFQMNNFKDLALVITQINVFEILSSKENTFDFYRYWMACQKNGIDIGTIFYQKISEYLSDKRDQMDWLPLILSCGRFCQELASYDASENIYRLCLEKVVEFTSGECEPIEAARVQGALGYLLRMRGKYNEAEELYLKALPVMEKKLKTSNPELAEIINSLAMVYRHQAKYEKAEPLYLRALSLRSAIFGEMHPDIAQSYNSLGCLNQDRAKFVEAEAYLLKAISLREALYSRNHPDVAMSLNNLGGLYVLWSKYSKAIPIFQRSLEIYRSVFGNNHPGVAQSLNALAGIATEMFNFDEAENLYEESLSIKEALMGEGHPEIATTLNDIAVLHVKQNSYSVAEDYYDRALEIRIKALGESHPDVAQSLNNLGALYQDTGDLEKAENFLSRGLAILEKCLGPNHMDVGTTLNLLAGVYHLKSDFMKAIPVYNRAIEILKNQLGENHADVAVSLNNFAILHYQMGNMKQAEKLYKKAIKIYSFVFGEEHPEVASAIENIAQFYQQVGNIEKSLANFRRALQLFELKNQHKRAEQVQQKIKELTQADEDY